MLARKVSPQPSQIEQNLVRALKRGDARAFEQLVGMHQDRVFGLCLRMMGNREEAEDLTQDVFLTIFRVIDRFRQESLLSTWIYRIARNHCLNRLKFLKRRAHGKKQSLQETGPVPPDGTIAPPVTSQVPRPDRLAEGKQMEVIIQAQINQLSDEHRELVVLRDIEHLSYDEIRQITGLACGTVKSRLHRARMELTRLMSPYMENPED